MALEVLGAEGRDAERWSALVAALPAELRDLHYLPEYGRIYRDTYGFEPSLAAWCDDDGLAESQVQRVTRRGDRFSETGGNAGFSLSRPD